MPMPDWRTGRGLEDGHIIRSNRLQFIISNGCEFAPESGLWASRGRLCEGLNECSAMWPRITRLEHWQQGH